MNRNWNCNFIGKVYFAEFRKKMYFKRNFRCGNSLRNKVYFAELKLRKMLLLLSYVTWIGVQFYRMLNHHAHKPRCALQEEILG